ncbi:MULTISPECIES: VOC family protein [Streptomyces]|uniref:VOC family protein n=1 Tax=Streptomyces TaxID=1883 RepID=UPI000A3CAEF0|nr:MULTISPECIES: VOC family protein [Streptomyces]MDX3637835.1 VOC family protein [Streptomyces europaeiscabiei]MDX3655649.1 VOC family protein [Streptomyces europaeiscabiei]WRZ53617.1 VOC family protein [Streptomyces sp. NBC_01314]WRZ53691.1 VOC family protein [Streptomyces sp. NBC_01314]
MPANGQSHIRVARPSRDLVAAEDFWIGGLGLSVLYRTEGGDAPGEHDLLMVGWPDASWHLELVHEAVGPVEPRPTTEDLLVIYLDEQVPGELVTRLEAHGGKRVPSHNPYWDKWGITVEDPDGYRLVLCTRAWSNS